VSKNGFNDYLTTELSLTQDWDFDQTSPNAITNDGSEGDIDLSVTGATYSTEGDVSYETDDALEFDGAGDYATDGSFTPSDKPDNVTGSIIMVFRLPASPNNDGVIFGVGSGASTNGMIFRHVLSGGEDVLQYQNNRTTADDVIINSAKQGAAGGIGYSQYHMWIVTQDGLGGDVVMYLNGADMGAHSFTSYTGSAAATDWFHNKGGNGTVAVGAHPAVGNNQFDGRVSRIAICSDVITPTQAAELEILRTQASLQQGANKRRRGRKFFKLTA
jgi:hypothetical protein